MSATEQEVSAARGIHIKVPMDRIAAGARPTGLQINPVRMSISRITDDELARMTANDLVDLLAYSSFVSQWADLLRELPRGGRNGLHLLALLARRRCRDEIDAIHLDKGRPSPQYV